MHCFGAGCVFCVVGDSISERMLDMLQSTDISMVASVLSAHHGALKLFLDRCVVTLESDTAAISNCDFINYHGSEPCLSPHIYTNRNTTVSKWVVISVSLVGKNMQCLSKRDTFYELNIYIQFLYTSKAALWLSIKSYRNNFTENLIQCASLLWTLLWSVGVLVTQDQPSPRSPLFPGKTVTSWGWNSTCHIHSDTMDTQTALWGRVMVPI